jgi:hypothetical protein
MQQAPTNGHRRRLPADQCGTKRGDRVPPGGRWLARSHRQRADGALVPEFRGVLETDDGATILCEWQGLAVLGGPRPRPRRRGHSANGSAGRLSYARGCRAVVAC